MRAAVIFLSLLLPCIALASSCPPEKDIKPCTCQYGMLRCEKITNTNDLIRVFKNSKGKINEVTMVHATLPYIPREILNDMELEYFFVLNSTIVKLFDFPPHNKIKSLQILHSKIFIRDWNLFRLNGFKHLNVANMKLGILDKHFVGNLPKTMKQITLRNTHTPAIKPGTFSDLKDMTALSVVEGNLMTLRRDIFPTPFNSIMFLSFKENKLTSIPADMFAHMPNLEIVELEDNKLITISEAAFGGRAPAMDRLTLDGNPIKCDCNLEWLVKKGPKRTTGTCTTPAILKGKALNQLTAKDFKC